MSASKGLERLLRIREIEEEQRRLQLESALAKRQTLERARETDAHIEKQGRACVRASVFSGALADRQAGLVEAESARKRVPVLATKIAAADKETIERRREFMEKRVERRQAETMIEQAEARDEVESARRSQRGIDDWFGARRHGQAVDEEH